MEVRWSSRPRPAHSPLATAAPGCGKGWALPTERKNTSGKFSHLSQQVPLPCGCEHPEHAWRVRPLGTQSVLAQTRQVHRGVVWRGRRCAESPRAPAHGHTTAAERVRLLDSRVETTGGAAASLPVAPAPTPVPPGGGRRDADARHPSALGQRDTCVPELPAPAVSEQGLGWGGRPRDAGELGV